MYTVKNPFKLFFLLFNKQKWSINLTRMTYSFYIEDLSRAFPLNLKCEIKDKKCPDFCGPGMYFMYYKDELV
ncbi:MAG: hypothetical protein ACKO7P_05200 [Bacteroidota bacterium]